MALLGPRSLARLERLKLLSRRAFASRGPGERRSVIKGSSAEFADHRPYHLGDDPRYLDWNVYARLERLFVKLFAQEVEVAVHVVVDASASMGFGSPTKLHLAKQLAAGLAYVALSGLDRAGLMVMGGARERTVPAGRGRVWMTRILRCLDEVEAGGRAEPQDRVKRYAALQKGSGLSIILSDFLDPGFPDGLKPLLHHRHEVWCVQILGPEDRGEDFGGDLELVDSETGTRQEVTAAPEVLACYRRQLDEHRAFLERWCFERGVGFACVGSESDFEGVMVGLLRRRRLLR